ncbi:MAG: PDZ domain-containing protein [Pirellulaceae bacterium]
MVALMVCMISAVALPGENQQASHKTTASQNESTVAFLGVIVDELHSAFWSHLREITEHRQGLLVVEVGKGSPAEKAGLKPLDVLLTYDDQKLFSPSQLQGLVRESKVGQSVSLGTLHSGQLEHLNVTLGKRLDPTLLPVARNRWPMARRMFRRPAVRSSNTTRSGAGTDWSTFDSMVMKSTGYDQFEVQIRYKADEGNIKQHSFKGTRKQIHDDIMSQQDLPDEEREHLLRTLDLPSVEIDNEFPAILFTPQGEFLWNFDSEVAF